MEALKESCSESGTRGVPDREGETSHGGHPIRRPASGRMLGGMESAAGDSAERAGEARAALGDVGRTGEGGAEPHAEADHALVARMRAGDDGAMRGLVDRHQDRLFALARGMTGGGADAEEVCADAFVQAWRTADRFDPARGSVSSWLTMITRSRALDRIRARKKRGRVADRLRTEFQGETTTGPETAARRVEVSEAARLVRGALDALPVEQKRVIELSYFGGLSQREISETLDIPLGTVKTRMLAAMKRLREQLAPLTRGLA